jgi:hypothetical protein
MSVPSQKSCFKKLRQIRILKTKKNLSQEELDKIQSETYYRDIIKNVYQTLLNCLPDEVQNIIWEYVDPNTRIACLKRKYPCDMIKTKLNALPKERSTIRKLFMCKEVIKPILKKYLKKDGDIYKSINRYIEFTVRECSSTLPNHCKYLYYEKLIYMIMAALQNYSKMYKTETNSAVIFENEKTMLKLYSYISIM